MCPPETNRQTNGKLSLGSAKKFAKICASKWLTPIIGIFKPIASPFENEVPAIRAPDKPGPLVTAIPSKFSKPIFESRNVLWIIKFYK